MSLNITQVLHSHGCITKAKVADKAVATLKREKGNLVLDAALTGSTFGSSALLRVSGPDKKLGISPSR